MSERSECAKCDKLACFTKRLDRGPENCPIKIRKAVLDDAWEEYQKPEIGEFHRTATIQEGEGCMLLPEGLTPRHPRVEEVAQFAGKMGYRRIGIAFCGGFREEASLLTKILENRGFEVVSVCCKTGGIPKEAIGVTEEQRVDPRTYEAMCNPIGQAKLLNAEETDFNVVLGLCVGHDSLFFKYAEAPTTVLIAKDRVMGHNPAAALYVCRSYYAKLLRKEPDGEEGETEAESMQPPC